MNRNGPLSKWGWSAVPHASGDEPYAPQLDLDLVDCSPREWG